MGRVIGVNRTCRSEFSPASSPPHFVALQPEWETNFIVNLKSSCRVSRTLYIVLHFSPCQSLSLYHPAVRHYSALPQFYSSIVKLQFHSPPWNQTSQTPIATKPLLYLIGNWSDLLCFNITSTFLCWMHRLQGCKVKPVLRPLKAVIWGWLQQCVNHFYIIVKAYKWVIPLLLVKQDEELTELIL